MIGIDLDDARNIGETSGHITEEVANFATWLLSEEASYISGGVFLIDGALNGIAVVAKAAEMALSLHRLTGSVVSRRGTYAKASPECIDEYLRHRW